MEVSNLSFVQFKDSDIASPSRIESALKILSDPKVIEHIFWKDIKSKEGASEWIKNRVEEDAVSYWIETKESNVIGFCGIIPYGEDSYQIEEILKNEDNSAGKFYEIAYVLGSEHWNKGYGTEVCKWLKKECENRKVVAFVNVENLPSQKVLLKNNFKKVNTPHLQNKLVFII